MNSIADTSLSLSFFSSNLFGFFKIKVYAVYHNIIYKFVGRFVENIFVASSRCDCTVGLENFELVAECCLIDSK